MAPTLQPLLKMYNWLNARPPGVRLLVGVALLCTVCLLDSRLHHHLALTSLYMLAVLITAIGSGFRWAAALAVVAATAETSWFVPEAIPAGVRVANFFGRLLTYGIVIWLVLALRNSLGAAQEAARHDFLTGLLNRRAFEEMAQLELERSRRNGQPISVLYLDVDDFKLVNDRYGHRGGDEVLHTIAEAMTATLRSTDIIARLGGDEFAAILPETTETKARAAASNLHEAVARKLAGSKCHCTCSLGVAVFAAPPESVEEMINRADELMYGVKAGGKGSALVDVFFGH